MEEEEEEGEEERTERTNGTIEQAADGNFVCMRISTLFRYFVVVAHLSFSFRRCDDDVDEKEAAKLRVFTLFSVSKRCVPSPSSSTSVCARVCVRECGCGDSVCECVLEENALGFHWNAPLSYV